MKAATLLINSYLPPDLRDETRIFSKGALDDLLAEVARRYPDRYSEIVQKIADVGRKSAYLQGETLTLKDMFPVVDKDAILGLMDQELSAIDPELPDQEKRRLKLGIWQKYNADLEKLTKDQALAQRNNLGNTVVSGARGNLVQLKSMVTTPALFTDYHDEPIELFVRRGYNEGLRPYEYLASTFGVRKGVISTKAATAESGDLLKQMTQASASTVVTDDDCGTVNGLDFDADSDDLIGRVLAKSYGLVPAGTPIDKSVMRELRAKKINKIIVRSPLTCQTKKGICASCLGLLPDGKFAPIGYSAGITAAQALGEPLTQGALNVKHLAGAAKGGTKKLAGSDIIDQLMQSPEVFPYRAAVSSKSGTVEKIEDAPQGGKLITVGGEQHYSIPGFDPIVKPGDQVEAGDQLSEGIMDVADIMKYRGLGEARAYYVDRIRQAYEESGIKRPSRINLETLARSTLNHVVVDNPEGIGAFLPDDVAAYNALSPDYSPPASTKTLPVGESVGQYLQVPALHFTIGTQLTPRMVSRLKVAGLSSVSVSGEEPKFHPEMSRLRAAAHSGSDWLAKLHSSYLMSNLQQDAARGMETNVASNLHFAPRLAIGEGFGKKIEQTGEF